MDTRIKKFGIVLAMVAVLILNVFIYKAGGIFSVTAFLSVGVIAVLVLFALCTPYGSENYFDRHKKGSILLMTAAVILLVVSVTLKYQLCTDNPGVLAPLLDKIAEHFDSADMFGYYTAQLSLTFITISVMSVLSDKSVVIYWANVSEDMLIRPTFSCFAAFTYYSIGATIGAGLGIILKNSAMFILFFALNVCVLICLTLSMIDVYYGRDTKKKKLAKTLIPNINDKASYENKILGLEQNILSAYDQKDMVFLREVYDFYCDYSEKFDFDVGREAISVMVSTLDAQTTGSFLRSLDKAVIKRLAEFPMNQEKIIMHNEQKRLYDAELWWTLISNRADSFLKEVSVGGDDKISPNGILLTRLIMRRLTLEYNRCVKIFLYDKLCKGEQITPEAYFVYDDPANYIYEPKTADGSPVSYDRFKEVLDYVKVAPCYDGDLFHSIIILINLMLKEGSAWYVLKGLSALPYIEYWADGGLENALRYNPDAIEAAKRIKEICDTADFI